MAADPVFVQLGPEGLQNAGGTLSMTSSSGATTAINAGWVDILTNAAAFISIGPDPTAVSGSGYPVPAGVLLRFPITPGNKIAAVTATTGSLWYHPVQSPAPVR